MSKPSSMSRLFPSSHEIIPSSTVTCAAHLTPKPCFSSYIPLFNPSADSSDQKQRQKEQHLPSAPGHQSKSLLPTPPPVSTSAQYFFLSTHVTFCGFFHIREGPTQTSPKLVLQWFFTAVPQMSVSLHASNPVTPSACTYWLIHSHTGSWAVSEACTVSLRGYMSCLQNPHLILGQPAHHSCSTQK